MGRTGCSERRGKMLGRSLARTISFVPLDMAEMSRASCSALAFNLLFTSR